jgi:hypothetical protein
MDYINSQRAPNSRFPIPKFKNMGSGSDLDRWRLGKWRTCSERNILMRKGKQTNWAAAAVWNHQRVAGQGALQPGPWDSDWRGQRPASRCPSDCTWLGLFWGAKMDYWLIWDRFVAIFTVSFTTSKSCSKSAASVRTPIIYLWVFQLALVFK